MSNTETAALAAIETMIRAAAPNVRRVRVDAYGVAIATPCAREAAALARVVRSLGAWDTVKVREPRPDVDARLDCYMVNAR